MSTVKLAEAKTHLNITKSDADGELQSTIDAAEATIAQHVGPLAPTTVTATLRGSSLLLLPTAPVISLTSITGASGGALTVGDFTLDAAAGIVTYSSGAWFGSQWYTVVYQAGRTTCPADLLFAVKELVRHLWESQRNPARFPGSSISDGPLDTPGAAYLMPYRVQELIAPHAVHLGFA